MKRRVLLDTGALEALLRAQDQFHSWAISQFAALEPPLLTCEAVITEACFDNIGRERLLNEWLSVQEYLLQVFSIWRELQL